MPDYNSLLDDMYSTVNGLGKMTNVVEKMLDDIDDYKRVTNTLRNDNETQSLEIIRLNDRVKELISELEDALYERDNAHEEVKDLQKELDSYERENAKLQDRVNELEEKVYGE